MNLTEAKNKYCPFVDFRETASTKKCRADQCAMWRWNHKIRKVNVSEKIDGQIWIDQDEGLSENDGYCGLGGKEK